VPPQLWLHPAAGRGWVRDKEASLTPQELELLQLLVEHAGQICMHSEICASLFPGSRLPMVQGSTSDGALDSRGARRSLLQDPARDGSSTEAG
jgi:hypothetical protein